MFKKILISISFLTLLIPALSLADYDPSVVTPLTNPTATVTANGATAQIKVANLIGNVIKTILGLIGSISLVILIYAGVRYMASQGNAEQSKSAIKTAVWAFLGVAVVFLSYLVLDLIFNALAPA